jgi:hypothetical protein
VAEVVIGEIARALGLLVPELVAVDVDPRMAAAEPDPEIQDLIAASAGLNLGVDFLPGSLAYAPGGVFEPSPELAAEVVWLDAFATNVDRTPRNPNLLVWHGRLWLIDHGAALYLQYGTPPTLPNADPAKAFPLIAEHVLLPVAGPITEADERLKARLSDDLIAAAVNLVPDDWFDGGDPPSAYIDYLTRRLATAAFAEEAERARR